MTSAAPGGFIDLLLQRHVLVYEIIMEGTRSFTLIAPPLTLLSQVGHLARTIRSWTSHCFCHSTDRVRIHHHPSTRSRVHLEKAVECDLIFIADDPLEYTPTSDDIFSAADTKVRISE